MSASANVSKASVFGPDSHAEVALHVPVPGFVVGSMHLHPLFVGHGVTPAKQWERIWSDGVPQLPSPALDDLSDLLRYQGRRRWVLERRGKQMGEPPLLRGRGGVGRIRQSSA